MSSKSSYYLPGSSDIKNLPEPTWVCEDCGGGSWKKIKKGSDVEKYLKFCRCDAEPDVVDAIVEEPVKPPPEEPGDDEEADDDDDQDDAAEPSETNDEAKEEDAEKPPEIPKHLRSRLKPKHHVPRKWNHEASFISED
jgi:hypothetical protein